MVTADREAATAATEHLPPALAEVVRRKGRRLTYRRGALVHGRGDEVDGLYVIAKGRVRIASPTESGRELILTDLGPGDLFGEISLLDGLPRTHDAICLEESVAMRLGPADFEAVLEAHPELHRYFLRTLASKLRMCFHAIDAATLLTAPQRLARRLLWLAGAAGPRGGTVRDHGRSTSRRAIWP